MQVSAVMAKGAASGATVSLPLALVPLLVSVKTCEAVVLASIVPKLCEDGVKLSAGFLFRLSHRRDKERGHSHE